MVQIEKPKFAKNNPNSQKSNKSTKIVAFKAFGENFAPPEDLGIYIYISVCVFGGHLVKAYSTPVWTADLGVYEHRETCQATTP